MIDLLKWFYFKPVRVQKSTQRSFQKAHTHSIIWSLCRIKIHCWLCINYRAAYAFIVNIEIQIYNKNLTFFDSASLLGLLSGDVSHFISKWTCHTSMFVSAGSDCVSGVGTKAGLLFSFVTSDWTWGWLSGQWWVGMAQLATPKFGLLLTKNVFDKSLKSSLQKLIPLSVSPLLLCRLKLSPHSQSRISEISLGDWISNSSASETIKFEKCALTLVDIPGPCLWWNIVMPRLIN